ncbi:CLUMA_CG000520, isoform A [Clunio marinus]|uniref:CLUMA_CG000520, isoform A n=1 Tax=Clunio marinus TaxID=568069 RepID=A0A1J1HFE1_9DIPT|nr:CLUMA_CG000520, isoform A [Clunio marinus]
MHIQGSEKSRALLQCLSTQIAASDDDDPWLKTRRCMCCQIATADVAKKENFWFAKLNVLFDNKNRFGIKSPKRC